MKTKKRIQDCLQFLLSNILFIATSLSITLLIAILYLLVTPRNYSSLIVVQLKEINLTKNYISSLYSIVGPPLSPFKIENELALFKSENALQEVLHKTHYNRTYLTPSLWNQKALYKTTPIEAVITEKEEKKISEKVILKIKNLPEEKFQIEIKEGSTHFSLKKKLPCNIKLSFGNLQLKKKKKNLQEQLIIKIEPIEKTIEKIKSNLTTRVISKNRGNIITARLKCNHPQKAIDFLNGLVQTYNQTQYIQKKEDNRILDYYIRKRIDNLKKELIQLDQLLQKEKQATSSLDLKHEIKILEKRKNKLILQKAKINQEIKQVNLLIHSILHKEAIITSLCLKGKELKREIQQYNQTFLNYKRVSQLTTKKNDETIFQKEKIETEKKQITQQLINYKESLLIIREHLIKQLNQQLFSQKKIPHILQKEINITKKKEIKQSLYNFLITEKEKTNYLTLNQLDRARIITSPKTSPYAVYPRIKIVLLLALFIGSSLPILYHFIKHFFSSKIKSKKEIKSHLDLPIIGTIPSYKKETKSLFYDRIAFIRNQLTLQKGTKGTIFLITSTIPQEGKTTIATHLAKSFSLLEKRTVLIGLNLHNPQIGSFFKRSSQKGIADYVEKKATKEEIITPIQDSNQKDTYLSIKNLALIQEGNNSLSQNELLSSSRLKELLKELQKEYDYILLDTPPIGIISNTIILAQQSDKILYIIRENYSSKKEFTFIKQLTNKQQLPETMIVINNDKITTKTYLI